MDLIKPLAHLGLMELVLHCGLVMTQSTKL